ncbi:hypothetical protein CAAN1_15S03004 [[Candida] anglica]|uniref:Securin n=1 Tax=[Candida] anglica TaxID=148631 RepID=A0ABP0EAU3_9ASCO
MSTLPINSVHTDPKNDSENAQVRSKVPVRRTTGLRVPLGGKDSNRAVPSLHRSHSNSLEKSTQPQRKRILLPRGGAPSLTKASSSLGFVHRPTTNLTGSAGGKSLKLQNSKATSQLHSQFASRSKQLIDTPQTDTLVKSGPSTPSPSHSPMANLDDTFSPQTMQLHGSNIPRPFRSTGDPQKRSKMTPPHLNDPLHAQILDDLSSDPSSVESIPERQPVISKPYSLEPLSEEDLDFFALPNRLTVAQDESNEYEEIIHKNEMDLKFREIDLDDPQNFNFEDLRPVVSEPTGEEELVPELQGVGLSVDELNDLIDF